MIQIVNISKDYDPIGEQTYEVSIVGRVRGTGEPFKEVKGVFTHNRINGLTICLEKAAEAVEKQKWMDFKERMVSLNDNNSTTTNIE